MSEDRSQPPSVRVYRALLRAYPRRFRHEYGPQMEQHFRDLYVKRRRSRREFVLLWIHTLSDLVPTAVTQRIASSTYRKEELMRNRRLAIIGFVLLLAPLYFVSASLLKYGVGIGLFFDPMEAVLSVDGRRELFNLVSPFVFLGGLFLALALNVHAVMRFDVGRENGAIVSTFRITPRLWNIAVALVSVLLLVTLVGYAFLENFAYRP